MARKVFPTHVMYTSWTCGRSLMKAPYAATLQAQQLSSMISAASPSRAAAADLEEEEEEEEEELRHLPPPEHRRDEQSLQAATTVLFDSFLKVRYFRRYAGQGRT